MIKILLVYENYNNLISVETSLKKIGFDVLGITNEYSLSEKILSFNPDLILASGEATGKVKTQTIGEKLREITRWQGKVILVFSENQDPTPEDLIRVRADQVLVEPVAIPTLLTTIAMLMRLDARVLLERLMRYSQGLPEADNSTQMTKSSFVPKGDEKIYVTSQGAPSAEVENQSEARLSSEEDVSLFSEVNFNELQKEIQGVVPSASGIQIDSSSDMNSPSSRSVSIHAGPDLDVELAADAEKIISELHDVEDKIEARVEKYKKYLKPEIIKGPPLLLSRIDAYKAHKEMSKDWDRQSLSKIDTERRRYTNFLFQKKK